MGIRKCLEKHGRQISSLRDWPDGRCFQTLKTILPIKRFNDRAECEAAERFVCLLTEEVLLGKARAEEEQEQTLFYVEALEFCIDDFERGHRRSTE